MADNENIVYKVSNGEFLRLQEGVEGVKKELAALNCEFREMKSKQVPWNDIYSRVEVDMITKQLTQQIEAARQARVLEIENVRQSAALEVAAIRANIEAEHRHIRDELTTISVECRGHITSEQDSSRGWVKTSAGWIVAIVVAAFTIYSNIESSRSLAAVLEAMKTAPHLIK